MVAAVNEFDHYGYGADRLKFLMLPLVCLLTFPLPGFAGSLLQQFCRFVPPAFYILSGFFVLTDDPDIRRKKLGRATLHSGLFFLFLFVFYLGLNAAWFTLQGVDWISGVLTKRRLFNFLVLCVWPFETGECIWFIQSLFYGWVILLVLDRIGLLEPCGWVIMLLTVGLMLVTGEFAAAFGFRWHGYSYFPANALTRALPYLLLGFLLRRHSAALFSYHPGFYIGLFVFGFAASLAETFLLYRAGMLLYEGHTIGGGIMAVCACCYALADPEPSGARIFRHARIYAKWVYALHQPVGRLLLLGAGFLLPDLAGLLQDYFGLAIFVLCLLTAVPYVLIKDAIRGPAE